MAIRRCWSTALQIRVCCRLSRRHRQRLQYRTIRHQQWHLCSVLRPNSATLASRRIRIAQTRACRYRARLMASRIALKPLAKATKAYYPDDPSNVYHSYINDHTKFRIHHGGTVATHVHHQHAHQWLQSPNSDEGSYLDSQMISPGASYTLEMTFNGSGNRNKVVGDSIFHCHFYPHFAAGMWAMWRTHDTFEAGSELDRNGIPVLGTRALPDGEIKAGTPTPAL